jgi:hypothetical protein
VSGDVASATWRGDTRTVFLFGLSSVLLGISPVAAARKRTKKWRNSPFQEDISEINSRFATGF